MLGLILVIGMNAYSITNTAWEHQMEIWPYGLEFFVLLMPLFISIPFSFKLFCEVKDGYLKNVFNRKNIKHYLRVKFMAGAFATYLSVFLIYFISFLVTTYILPMTPAGRNDPFGNFLSEFSFYNHLMFEAPLLFGLLISV